MGLGGFLGFEKGDLRAYYLGVLVCIGGFLFGYDTGVVSKYYTVSLSYFIYEDANFS